MEVLEIAPAAASHELKDVLFAQEGLEPFFKCMGYKSLHAGSARKALTRTVCYNKQFYMTDALIRKLVRENRVPTMREENRIQSLSPTAYLRADNSEKEAHERKIRDGGKKTVYSLDLHDLQLQLGSYEYAYAIYLYALHKAASN